MDSFHNEPKNRELIVMEISCVTITSKVLDSIGGNGKEKPLNRSDIWEYQTRCMICCQTLQTM